MDYAINYTARYKLRYVCGGMTHTQQWRMGTAANLGAAASAINAVQEVWLYIAPLMASDLAFLDAVFYPVNSNVAIPAPLPFDMESVTPSATADTSAGPKYLSVPWQTTAGGKQTTFFYGTIVEPASIAGDNYRIEEGEDVNIDNALTAMAAVVLLMTGNDRSPGYGPKRYANYGVNPALVRRRRRG